jgi:stage II sporulation protein D
VRGIFAALALSAWLGGAPAAAFPTEVNVQLFQSRGTLRHIRITSPVEIIAPRFAGRLPNAFTLVCNHGRVAIHATEDSRGITSGEPLLAAPSLVIGSKGRLAVEVQLPDGTRRAYRGRLIVRAQQGGLVVSNTVRTLDYVKSVVGSETNPDFPLEELKAQSVLAQTLIARIKPGDWLPDTTEKQAYMGANAVRAPVSAAVDATWGELLTYNDAPAEIYFHSTCAGGTSDGNRYFVLKGNNRPYLKGVMCSYCRESPFWKTKAAPIPAAIWRAHFGGGSVRVLQEDERGRPLAVDVGGRRVSGYQMWMMIGQKLGWDKVPGTRYQLRQLAGGNIVITSTGAGHGVGLCQWGACGMARSGKTYQEILKFYFPQSVIRELGSNAKLAG